MAENRKTVYFKPVDQGNDNPYAGERIGEFLSFDTGYEAHLAIEGRTSGVGRRWSQQDRGDVVVLGISEKLAWPTILREVDDAQTQRDVVNRLGDLEFLTEVSEVIQR